MNVRNQISPTGVKKTSLFYFQLQNIDAAISRTEKGNKAKHFYQIARSKAVWLMIHFMLDVLHIVGEVSKKFQFQLRTPTLSEIMSEIDFAVKSLEKLKVRYAVK